MATRFGVTALIVVLWAGSGSAAEQTPPMTALARMPVREVTVFKDGHALVLHEGAMATDAAGNVVMDYLPTPVIGTFWPYSSDKAAKLTSVVAGQHRLLVERTALALVELVEANVGAEVIVTEKDKSKYPATIVGVPTRSAEELNATKYLFKFYVVFRSAKERPFAERKATISVENTVVFLDAC